MHVEVDVIIDDGWRCRAALLSAAQKTTVTSTSPTTTTGA
jgi:hypothetical protein